MYGCPYTTRSPIAQYLTLIELEYVFLYVSLCIDTVLYASVFVSVQQKVSRQEDIPLHKGIQSMWEGICSVPEIG